MNGWEYLALALELWTTLGVIGLGISLVRSEKRKLVQGFASLAGVWVVYLGGLLFVSLREPERHLAPGHPACFQAMCFTITRVEELPGFPLRNHVRLLRVTVRVENRGTAAKAEAVGAYLRDGQGRIWPEAVAVSGNPLDERVVAGGSVISQAVFQIAPDATGLALVLTHGRWSRHRVVIGDAESLGHRLRQMELGR